MQPLLDHARGRAEPLLARPRRARVRGTRVSALRACTVSHGLIESGHRPPSDLRLAGPGPNGGRVRRSASRRSAGRRVGALPAVVSSDQSPGLALDHSIRRGRRGGWVADDDFVERRRRWSERPAALRTRLRRRRARAPRRPTRNAPGPVTRAVTRAVSEPPGRGEAFSRASATRLRCTGGRLGRGCPPRPNRRGSRR